MTLPLKNAGASFSQAALEATQGQINGFFSHLPYKCYLEEMASMGDWFKICPQLESRVDPLKMAWLSHSRTLEHPFYKWGCQDFISHNVLTKWFWKVNSPTKSSTCSLQLLIVNIVNNNFTVLSGSWLEKQFNWYIVGDKIRCPYPHKMVWLSHSKMLERPFYKWGC